MKTILLLLMLTTVCLGDMNYPNECVDEAQSCDTIKYIHLVINKQRELESHIDILAKAVTELARQNVDETKILKNIADRLKEESFRIDVLSEAK